MRTPYQPVFGSQSISPRSLGYSYLPGMASVALHAPSQIRTFGSAVSPQPGSSPITPQRVGALTNGSAPQTGLLNRLANGLFG